MRFSSSSGSAVSPRHPLQIKGPGQYTGMQNLAMNKIMMKQFLGGTMSNANRGGGIGKKTNSGLPEQNILN